MTIGLAVLGAGFGAALGVPSARVVDHLSGARPPNATWVVVVVPLETMLGLWGGARESTTLATAISVVLSAALLVLACVDTATLRLPDLVTLPLIAAGLATAVWRREALSTALIGVIAGWGAIAALAYGYRRIRGRSGIGMGDAKLLGAAGAWLGWRSLPWMVLLACLLAFAWVGVRLWRQGRSSLGAPLPFGSPLAAAFWIVWLYESPLG